jgi:hypothetical protein
MISTWTQRVMPRGMASGLRPAGARTRRALRTIWVCWWAGATRIFQCTRPAVRRDIVRSLFRKRIKRNAPRSGRAIDKSDADGLFIEEVARRAARRRRSI